MKIIIKGKANKKSIEEWYYVYYSIKKIMKNPNKKIYSMPKIALLYTLCCYILFFIFLLLYVNQDGMDNIFFSAFFCVLFVIYFLFYLRIKRLVKIACNIEKEVTFAIDKNGIKIDSISNGIKVSQEYKLNSLKHIIITKNNIYFLTNNINSPFISINVKYKQDILEESKKLKINELVINKEK